MRARLLLPITFALVANPCGEGVTSVSLTNPGEWLEQGQSYAVQCYLVDPSAGGCKTLLEKGLPAQPEKATKAFPVLVQQGRVLDRETDRNGEGLCAFKVPGSCSYEEKAGDLVVVLSRAQGLNPASAQAIADGCAPGVTLGTGKKNHAKVRLARRDDAPADVAIPNPLGGP